MSLIPTTITLKSSANPSVAGQPVTFIATVIPRTPAVRIPTGKVGFDIDGAMSTIEVPVSIINGRSFAMLILPALAEGEHGIVCKYRGDGHYAGSANAVVKQVVTAAPIDPPLVPGGPVYIIPAWFDA